MIDGGDNSQASIFEWSASSGTPTPTISPAPPPLLSPDGTHQIVPHGPIRRLVDNVEWSVNVQDQVPAISADNSRLLWEVRSETSTDFWVSNIDGSNAQAVVSQLGGSALWLDEARLLIQTPLPEVRATTLSVLDTRDSSRFDLGTWNWIRGLSIAPGGDRIMFYVNFQDDPAQNAIYSVATQPGAAAERMPWFGSWRWRDADSLYYIPFDPITDQQSLSYYHLPSGTNRALTDAAAQPFTIANGLWSVSADGRRIVFFNAVDRATWLLEEV